MSSSEKYECTICGWIYDSVLGLPEHGVAAGTAWQDLPVDFECPDCGIGKDYFELLPE